MPHLNLRLLGPFTAAVNHNTLEDFRSEKERALLAYLAMHADRALRREQLAALFWPDDGSSARRNLRLTLHRLREQLDEAGAETELLSANRSQISLDSKFLELDVNRFTKLLTPCTQSECHQTGVCLTCQRRIEKACHLYKGPFLSSLRVDDSRPFMEWMAATRERLQRQALTAMYGLTEVKQQQGELAEARLLAERQLELVPWREAAHRQLMGLMARAGESTAALNQLEICRQRLRQHLDLGPSRTTLELAEQIRSASRAASKLLPPANSLVGQHDKVEEIRLTLGRPEVRLVTICGPQGSGKVALAREVGYRIQPAFLSGARLINRDAYPLDMSLWQLLAKVFELQTSEGRHKEPVLRSLPPIEILLIFDSFDQRRIPTGHLEELLRACPGIKVLATASRPFGAEGEVLFEIHSSD